MFHVDLSDLRHTGRRSACWPPAPTPRRCGLPVRSTSVISSTTLPAVRQVDPLTIVLGILKSAGITRTAGDHPRHEFVQRRHVAVSLSSSRFHSQKAPHGQCRHTILVRGRRRCVFWRVLGCPSVDRGGRGIDQAQWCWPSPGSAAAPHRSLHCLLRRRSAMVVAGGRSCPDLTRSSDADRLRPRDKTRAIDEISAPCCRLVDGLRVAVSWRGVAFEQNRSPPTLGRSVGMATRSLLEAWQAPPAD